MYGPEVEDSKSKGRISKLRHFIRQKRLFATKGYFSCGIGIVICYSTLLNRFIASPAAALLTMTSVDTLICSNVLNFSF